MPNFSFKVEISSDRRDFGSSLSFPRPSPGPVKGSSDPVWSDRSDCSALSGSEVSEHYRAVQIDCPAGLRTGQLLN
jgi:hypothetical protein